MNIFRSMNDRVTLVKKDGQRFENLPALVQSRLILTDNPKIPIEDGDQFERQLPSGIVDVYTVVESGVSAAFSQHSVALSVEGGERTPPSPHRVPDQRRDRKSSTTSLARTHA